MMAGEASMPKLRGRKVFAAAPTNQPTSASTELGTAADTRSSTLRSSASSRRRHEGASRPSGYPSRQRARVPAGAGRASSRPLRPRRRPHLAADIAHAAIYRLQDGPQVSTLCLRRQGPSDTQHANPDIYRKCSHVDALASASLDQGASDGLIEAVHTSPPKRRKNAGWGPAVALVLE